MGETSSRKSQPQSGTKGPQADEGPQTVVTLSHGFWMGKFDVTPSLDTSSLNADSEPEVYRRLPLCGTDCCAT